MVSSVLVTIAAFSLFIWALVKQGNVGPLWNDPETVYGVGRLSGSKLSWAMMRMITSGIGGWAGGILYQSGLLGRSIGGFWTYFLLKISLDTQYILVTRSGAKFSSYPSAFLVPIFLAS